jgi:hypothetical protein
MIDDSWEDSEAIVNEYLALSNISGHFKCVYEFNEDCDMHEIWSSHSTSFIRDDPRFKNRRVLMMIEAKAGKSIPNSNPKT